MSDESAIPLNHFTDRKGNIWAIVLNHGMIEDIHEHTSTKIDALLKEPEKFASLLLLEPHRVVEILYIVCEEQIEERKLEPRDFGRLMDRESIDRATDAFLAALVLFYQRASAGKALVEKLPAILKKMDRDITEQIRHASPEELSRTTTDLRVSSVDSTGKVSVHSPPDS